ncbi:MAG: GNAT family N-acetyltransferase [Promethearchaeota archaeon Loki_b31]|nr:MAG: GNAT family N-acetyltransferase [Candidatus Lokiarchaeota archaeon Loki_b31]
MKIELFTMRYYHDIINLWKRSGIEVSSSDTQDEIAKILKRNPDLFLIGKEGENVVAVGIGAFDGRRGYVHHLAIDPDYQKKKYGKMMMDDLIERFRKKKVHKVHLFIEKHNEEVVDFYKKLGWDIRDDLIMMSFVPDKSLYKRDVEI